MIFSMMTKCYHLRVSNNTHSRMYGRWSNVSPIEYSQKVDMLLSHLPNREFKFTNIWLLVTDLNSHNSYIDTLHIVATSKYTKLRHAEILHQNDCQILHGGLTLNSTKHCMEDLHCFEIYQLRAGHQ